MRSRAVPFLSRAIAACVLLSVLAVPSLAIAATTRTDVWKGGTVSLTDLSADKEPTLVITLQLKSNIKPPTDYLVSVPVPTGSVLIWAGEVFGSDPKNDIQAQGAKIVKTSSGSAVNFKMTTSTVAQVEVVPAPGVISMDGNQIKLQWSPIEKTDLISMGVVVPAGYHGVPASQITTVVAVAAGAQAYVREYRPMKAKEAGLIELTIANGAPVSAGASSAVAATASAAATAAAVPAVTTSAASAVSGPQVILIILVVLLVVAVAVLVMVVMRSRKDPTDI